MRDDDAAGSCGANGLHQTGPVGVVTQDKAFVVAAPPARAAQLHPAAGKGIAEVTEPFAPGA